MDTDTQPPTAVSFESTGGARPATLQGSLFLPRGLGEKAPRRAIVLHPATGVAQGYYGEFARWLAEQEQAAVLTYDYRDFGRSGGGRPRHSPARMSDWGIHDQSAALDWLCARYPALPIWAVGHSLGGQFGSWHDRAGRLERIVAVASGPVFWREHPLGYLPKVMFFWFLGGPLLTRLLGYLPGRLLALGPDLPAGVFWQWRRWCLSPRFNRDDWGTLIPAPDLNAVTARLDIVAVEDDKLVTPASTRALAALYPVARACHRVLTPKQGGLQQVGHLRIFSARCRALWPALMAAEPVAGAQAERA